MPHDKRDPSIGDLMEIKRQGFQHWALYVGGGYVIYVTDVGKACAAVTGCRAKVKVRKNLLKEVAGDEDWYVNNKHDWYCTPLPVEEIIERAESWIDKVMPYDELGSNFERFMTKLRYGDAISFQVRHLLAARCSPRGWDTACTLHGDSQGPGVGSRAALPLGCPQPLHLEGHCALSAP
uniref:LRAT domain-containing protein n=1 Tax=Malurus cyaneus samueli TaxID=2593467 RepID=A0A8C5UJF8_9PASS